mgnify:CR=1 FL=1
MFLLSARDCIKYNGNLVFMTEETSLPVMLDVEKGEVRYMPISIKPDRIAPVDLAVKIGTNGFFLEVSGEHIIEYKIETAEISEYPISCHKMADGNYAFVTAEEKQILIFTSALQKLVIFDMETKKIKEVPYPDNVREIVFGCGCRCGKEVWLFPKLGGKLLCYHTDSGKYESYCLDIVLEKSVHAIRDNGCIYILTWVGEVYEFDIHNRKLEQITSLRELLKDHTVSCLFPSDGKMIILPAILPKHTATHDTLISGLLLFHRNSYKFLHFHLFKILGCHHTLHPVHDVLSFFLFFQAFAAVTVDCFTGIQMIPTSAANFIFHNFPFRFSENCAIIHENT